jgi:hypothetical protein
MHVVGVPDFAFYQYSEIHPSNLALMLNTFTVYQDMPEISDMAYAITEILI